MAYCDKCGYDGSKVERTAIEFADTLAAERQRGERVWREAVAAIGTLAEWRIDYWAARDRLRDAGQRAEEAEERLQGWEDGSGAGALQVQQHIHGVEERLATAQNALRAYPEHDSACRTRCGGICDCGWSTRFLLFNRKRLAALPKEEGSE